MTATEQMQHYVDAMEHQLREQDLATVDAAIFRIAAGAPGWIEMNAALANAWRSATATSDEHLRLEAGLAALRRHADGARAVHTA